MVKKLPVTLAFLTAGIIFASQLAYRQSNLPIGFESEKALFLFVAGATALAGLVLLAIQAKLKVKPTLPGVVLLFLGTLILLATVFTSHPESMLTGSKFRFLGGAALMCLAAVFSLGYLQMNWQLAKLILWAFLLFTALNAMLGLLDASKLSWEAIVTGNLVNGNFGQANFFGDTMLAGTLVGSAGVFFLRGRERLVALGAVFSTLPALILSFSYGAWVTGGLLLGIVLVGLLAKKLRLKWNWLAILVAVLTIIASFAYYQEASRRIIWPAVMQVIVARPLLGHGPDTLTSSLQALKLLGDRFIDRAHNFPLDVAAWFGLPALLAMLALVWLTSARIQRKLQETNTQLTPMQSWILISFSLLLGSFWFSGLVHTKSLYHFAEVAVTLGVVLKLTAPLVSKKSRN